VKVTKDKTENSQAYLTVEIDPDELEKALQEAYKHLVARANIPGFRKGKAPREVLERHLGKEALLEHAINDMIPEAYQNALKEQNLEPIAQGEIEIVQLEPLIFKATVPLNPVVKLGDYKSIRMKPEEATVEEDQVDKVIEQLRHQNATWEPVERPVAFNDLVTIDIKSEIEGKSYINRDGLQYQVEEGTSFPIKGFAEQLVGMNRNEEKEFKLSFPEDYSNKDLAGKEVLFKIKVNEIKQEKLPAVNEDFVRTVSSQCEDLASLRKTIYNDLKTRKEEEVKNNFSEKVIQTLIDMSQIEYPPVLVEQETDRLLNQQMQYLQASGLKPEDYLKMIKKSVDELREDLKPRAVKRVTQSLVLKKLAEEEQIEVTDEEINYQISELVQGYPENKQEEMKKSFNSEASRASIREALLIRKGLLRLEEIAQEQDTSAVKSDNQE